MLLHGAYKNYNYIYPSGKTLSTVLMYTKSPINAMSYSTLSDRFGGVATI